MILLSTAPVFTNVGVYGFEKYQVGVLYLTEHKSKEGCILLPLWLMLSKLFNYALWGNGNVSEHSGVVKSILTHLCVVEVCVSFS